MPISQKLNNYHTSLTVNTKPKPKPSMPIDITQAMIGLSAIEHKRERQRATFRKWNTAETIHECDCGNRATIRRNGEWICAVCNSRPQTSDEIPLRCGRTIDEHDPMWKESEKTRSMVSRGFRQFCHTRGINYEFLSNF